MPSTYYVAWWNVENLFDEENSPRRTDKLARAIEKDIKGWTPQLRDRKIAQLASVIAQMNGGAGPDLLGVCEIENRFVLDRLVKDLAALLPDRTYGVVHADTDDARGIDVAFIHDTEFFEPQGQAGEQARPRLRLPAHRRRRLQPPGLHRAAQRRAGPDRCWVLAPGQGVVRRPGHRRRAGAHRQPLLLPGCAVQRGLAETRVVHKYCRPYRPQTNGKVERFHRTLLEEWAYVRPYSRDADRTAALARWLHRYNHHRVHTSVGGPPISRVTNLPREHT